MKHLFIQVIKEIRRHLFDYLILITGGLFFLIFLKLFQGEKTATFIITLIFISIYIIWGIYHHILNETPHLKNLIEYIIVGFTILLLLMVILSF